jgi:hypothetical protein
MENNGRQLTQNEKDLLGHVMMFGSDSYPVRKVGKKWIVDTFFGVKASPVCYKTKKAATLAFENFVRMLVDIKAGRAIGTTSRES